MNSVYDYIIVGAGSAGCVLAERLSESPEVQVLLIEAGSESTNRFIPIPMGIGKTLTNPALNWYFMTEPDPGNANRPAMWLRGKTIGGSSAINGMIYCRGHRADYDEWAANGCTGWSWNDMAPIFKKMENYELGDGGKRGVGGPVNISIQTHKSPLTEAILLANEQLGVPRVADVNESDQACLGYTPVTIKKGRRAGANDAFLKPARMRPNLHVVTDTTVTRILFEERRAVGVEANHNGVPVQYHARMEVILSAGAILSPKILQLSGVGPADYLKGKGIAVVHDSPGVGAHMREHKIISMQLRLTKPYSHNSKLRGAGKVAEGLKYLLSRRGILASTYDLNGFIKTDEKLDRPDAQITFWSLSWRRDSAAMELEDEPGMTVFGYPNRTDSEGSVMIRSSDPNDPPVIQTNFLSTEHDRRIIVGIFRHMRRVIAQDPVKNLVKSEIWPGPEVQTDAEILEASRQDGTCFHAVGTCRMGIESDAVVDERLRVRGVTGLRVMDCSILPTQISGNTNGPIMAMAWRASQLILEDRKLSNQTRSAATVQA